ncbi:MAG: hypothetical protein U1A78_30160 [Polyangia bacterium]
MSGRLAPGALAAVLAVLSWGGCAPSLSTLIAERSFADALCLVEQRHLGGEAQQRLLRALLTASEQSIQVDALPPTALAAALGKKGEELGRRFVFYRFAYSLPSFGRPHHGRHSDDAEWLARSPEHSSITVPEAEATLELRIDGKAQPLWALDRQQLAALTGELLPGPRVVTVPASRESSLSRTLRQLGGVFLLPFDLVGSIASAGVNAGIGIASLGTARQPVLNYRPLQATESLLRDRADTPGGTHTEYPTEEELDRAAPLAAALFRLGAECRPRSPFGPPSGPLPFYRCAFVAVPRPPAEGEARAELQARLRFAYAVGSGRDARCTLRTELRIPLPAGPTVEERLAAALGGGRRRLLDWLPK